MIINLPACGITVELVGGCGAISSELTYPDNLGEPNPFVSAGDVLESLILAHAVAGVDVTDPKYVAGLLTTVEKLTNML